MTDSKSGWLWKRSGLWATRDGGASWQERSLPQLKPGDYADVHFVDQQNGWLLTASQQLYQTRDAGIHWLPVDRPVFDDVLYAAWIFPKTETIWLAGGQYRPSASPDAPNYALKKYDSGGWGVLSPILYSKAQTEGQWVEHQLRSYSWAVVGLRFWDQRQGIAVGDGSTYMTNDGGSTWVAGVFLSGQRRLRGYPDEGAHPTFYFLDRDRGWLSLDNQSLYRTENGGKDWNQARSGSVPHFDTLVFADPAHGLAVAGRSTLYETRDGGVKWRLVKTDFTPRFVCPLDRSAILVLSDTDLYRVSLDQ